MRISEEYRVFCRHHDWYTVDKEKGYIPTDKAPDEAREAMKIYNEKVFHRPE